MISDGLGTLIGALLGSPFGTVIYIGHPGERKCDIAFPSFAVSEVSNYMTFPYHSPQEGWCSDWIFLY